MEMKQNILNLFPLRSVKDKQENIGRVGKRLKGQGRAGQGRAGKGKKKR